jgi:hypothetical protein
MDLIGMITNGTMQAAAAIAREKGFADTMDHKAVCEAMREVIADGFKQAAQEALDALEACGEKWAQTSLKVACVGFAEKALIQCGYLTALKPAEVN